MIVDSKFIEEKNISDFIIVIGAGPAGITLCNELHEKRNIQKNLNSIFKADYLEYNTLRIQGWIFSYNECCFILSLAAQK